jgi:hypothetical protein
MPQFFRSRLADDPNGDVLLATTASFISPTLIYRPCMAPANYLARTRMPPKSKAFECGPGPCDLGMNLCLVICD